MFGHKVMRIHGKSFSLALGVFLIPLLASAAPLERSVLANDGTVYEVHSGLHVDLFPALDPAGANAEESVLVLDITRPGETVERTIVPPTSGEEFEFSPGLLYSKETGQLNVVWESHQADEVSVLLARFDGVEWASIDEIFFDSAGHRPTIAVTTDAFHVDIEDGPSIDAERQILHLIWSQSEATEYQLGYSPVILLNGTYIGSQETLSLPHLNPDANQEGDATLPEMFQITVNDSDFDQVSLSFASSATRLATTYRIDITPMEVVHLGDLIRDFVLEGEGFNPQNIAAFADQLGITIIDTGRRRQFRSRSVLSSSVLDYVASGASRFVREHGVSYGDDQLATLADDVKQEILQLSSSLYFPASATTSQAKSKSSNSFLVINVSDALGDEASPARSHVLELRSAFEVALPDSGGNEMKLLTSDSGQDFLAAWPDAENVDLLWYVESKPDGTWSEAQALLLSDSLTLKQAHSLLAQRLR